MADGTLNLGGEEGRVGRVSAGWLRWLPIAILLLAIPVFWAMGLRSGYPIPLLTMTLNFCFSVVASVVVAGLVGRGFLLRGEPSLLLMGCGVVTLGAASFVASALDPHAPNLPVTVFSVGAWLSAWCHLGAAVATIRFPQTLGTTRRWWLVGAYLAVLVAVGLVTLAGLRGWTATFFMEGQGGSPARYVVLTSAIVAFMLAAMLLWSARRTAPSPFLHWYIPSLLLLALGLLAVMLQLSLGSALFWTGRVATLLGITYMLVAAIASQRQGAVADLSLGRPLAKARYRYGIAILFVSTAAAVRLAFLAALGVHVPFVTFYPAVMIAALYGGLGPGLLATALSGLVATHFWLPPVRQFDIANPADLLGLAIFLASGALVSGITEAMQRANARMRQAETETRVAAERLQAAEELREGEQRYRGIVETAEEGIATHGPDGTITYVNQRMADMLGYSRQELVGKSSLDFVDDEQREAVIRARQSVMERGSFSAERKLRRRDGTILWTLVNISPRRDAVGYLAMHTDITARKQAEEALRLSEEKFAKAFANNPAAMALTRLDEGTFLDVNDTWVTMYGYSREEVIGRSVKDLPIWPNPGARDRFVQELREKGSVRSWEQQFHRKSGEVLIAQLSAQVLRVQSEQVVLSAFLDVTERKQAEAALARSEEQLRLAQAAGRIGTFDWDIPSNRMQGTPEIEALYGLAPGSFGGTYEQWCQLLHPDDRERVIESLRRAMSGGTTEDEFRVVWPDGTIRWLSARGRVSTDASGKPLRMIGVNQDITEHKQAEAALRESRAKLQAALASMTDAVFIANARGQAIVEFNDAFVAFHRFADREQCLRTLPEYTANLEMYLPDGTLARVDQWPVQRAVHGEAEIGIEYTLRRKDTGESWVGSYSFAPIRDKEARIVGCVVTSRDVTQRKRAEEELQAAKLSADRAKAAAEEASKAKDQFLAVLSHELRTPLTPVVAAVSMLQKGVEDEQTARDALEMIRRNVEMEARLIDDLLDVTRIVRGKVELQRQPTLLCEIIRRAVEVCKPDIETRQIHFGVDLGSSAPYLIDADPTRLQQVFWNLLKNAVKFTPHGGCIGIRCHREDGHVITEVKDSGEGIEPHLLPHIFNPFEQGGARVTRQFGGLGLGLTITKGVVEMHGGTIEAHSDGKGKGATFRVRLPLCAAGEQVLTQPPSAEAAAQSPATAVQKLRILLVEDHGDTARMMRRLLRSRGYEVETVGDVATALELAEHESFDLLLSDLGLPDGSGIDLMQKLRERGRSLPGIALSGFGQEEDIRRSKEAGFAAHLTKPTNPDLLTRTIGMVVRPGAAG